MSPGLALLAWVRHRELSSPQRGQVEFPSVLGHHGPAYAWVGTNHRHFFSFFDKDARHGFEVCVISSDLKRAASFSNPPQAPCGTKLLAPAGELISLRGSDAHENRYT